MVSSETFSRIRSIHKRRGASHGHSKGRDIATRSGVQETSRLEPAKARAEAEGRALRFPRGKRPLVDFRYFPHLAGEFGIREALAGDLRYRQTKPLCVVHVLPGVISQCLFIDVAEQVEGFHADVGPVQAALEQAPGVLDRVRVDISIHVFNGVIDNAVLIVGFQPVVRLQFIAEDRGPGLDVLTDGRLKGSAHYRR